jgi:hypothetical protein
MNFSSSLLTPFVTPVHLEYQTTGHKAITSEEGPEPGFIIVCFIVHKTTLELERVILNTP